ncbi:MAG: NERD domain-containing protein [Polyangiaceae bacterium]|nr:NERD domain-containing protein [Polyangiaceae bacterium]
MLSASRIERIGETPHAHERDALRVIEEVLPNSEPFHVWELFHLLDPSTGRLLEIDALIMGYLALYLVEIKSGPGLYEGNPVDWYWTPPEGGKRSMDPPLRLIDLKAKTLKSRLQARLAEPKRAPRIEPLVFLSAEDVTLRFEQYGDLGVVTRATLARAVQFHQFSGQLRTGKGAASTNRSGSRSPGC